jgi:hypothetical protein
MQIISFSYNVFFNSSSFEIIVEKIKKEKAENSTVLYVVKW